MYSNDDSVCAKFPNLAIAISFLYRDSRLAFLDLISVPFKDFADCAHVYLFTQTNRAEEKDAIRSVLQGKGVTFSIHTPELLGHPYLLTWCHFTIFRDLLDKDPSVSHFMYLEDDILLTKRNIEYWVQGRQDLKAHGFIPSFLRYEQKGDDELYMVDIPKQVDFDTTPKLFVNDSYCYMNMPSPYQGMYLMDRELMVEHMSGPSSIPGSRLSNVMESAAMGLAFEKIPDGFTFRHLAGFDTNAFAIDPRCLVHHVSNTYVAKPESKFGKISYNNLVIRTNDCSSEKYQEKHDELTADCAEYASENQVCPQNRDVIKKRQMFIGLLLNLYDKYAGGQLSKLYLDDELYRLIRCLLAVISDDDKANVLALRSFDALQDEESKCIYACLFLYRCVGVSDITVLFAEMVLKGLKKRLMEKGKNLNDYGDYGWDFFCGKSYFSLPQMKLLSSVRGGNEVFIDCGAYDGETIKDFVEFCGGKYDKIYSFEPIPRSYKYALQAIKNAGIQRVELIQKGVWSHKAVLNFADIGQASRINDKGAIPVEVVAIDEVVPKDEKVTFIKMDVEGAEFEALKGAENTIRRCRPNLAICIYHVPTDVVEIPALIMSFLPEYKFYIRHHHITLMQEIVLYALPQ